MELLNLLTNEINQNNYHFNKLTRNKIGILYIAPVNMIPEDCLACDGYVLKISDYKNSILQLEINSILERSNLMNSESPTTILRNDFCNLEVMLEKEFQRDYQIL